jgi:serine/threonine-protein kinase
MTGARAMPVLIQPTLASAEEEEEEPTRVRGTALRDLLAPGDVVAGTYEVRAKIGEGGMGQVYEARDRALGRRVAIKISAPHERVSLGNEARALATLRHPSIVAVHAFGEHDGKAYLVMERVPGTTLHERVLRLAERRERLSVAEVVDLLVGIAEGLAVVHAAGMAHRDVKPSNVLLAPGDRVVLADFGVFQPQIAVRTSHNGGGSPHYFAPEAMTGNVDPGLVHLIDVYALGIVAYELLTGSVPFDDRDVMKILWMHVYAPPPDPAAARPDTPPSLAALVRAMLAKDPLDRPRGMDEVVSLLRRVRARLESPARCSVLLVEDNAATATLVESMVSAVSDDVTVRVARDASEALEALRAGPADLVIVDLHLPAMSGVELCRRLRDMRVAEGSTIVATSAHATSRELQAIRALGVVQYVPKGEELAGNIPALVHAAVQRANARQASRPAASGSGPRAVKPARRPRVLFVEDHDDTRDIYAWCMRAAGWEVDAVGRGAEAVAVAALFQPDVVVMDLHMPVMSGIEATRRLKEDRRTADIPVVACTAFGREHEAELRAGGFRFVVRKPCAPADLRAVLEGIVPGSDE